MTQEDVISKLIEKMEGKYEVSKWKKDGQDLVGTNKVSDAGR